MSKLASAAFLALDQLSPKSIVKKYLTDTDFSDLSGVSGKVFLFALGKAAVPMAEGFLLSFDRVDDALIIAPSSSDNVYFKNELSNLLNSFVFIGSEHPIPGGQSARAADAAISFFSKVNAEDIVVCLISGGGSSLMSKPVAGISLQDKLDTLKALLVCGAPERELNVIKKSLSAVKGGKLTELTTGKILNLIISDEREDLIDAISSGPTVFNKQINPMAVINQFGLEDIVPKQVLAFLKTRFSKNVERGSTKNVESKILASRQELLVTCADILRHRCPDARIIFGLHLAELPFEDAKRAFLAQLEEVIEKMTPPMDVFVLFSGEIPVQVDSSIPGSGGRNQHLALALINSLPDAMLELSKLEIVLLASDGVDFVPGVRGVAMTQRDIQTLKNAPELIENHLNAFDSGSLLRQFNLLLEGPATLNNFSDIFLVRVQL